MLDPLLAEAEGYAAALRGRLGVMQRLGVLPGMFRLGQVQPPCGIAHARFDGPLWRPDPAGTEVIVIPVCNPLPLEPFGLALAVGSVECVDIVAIDPRLPARWHWRTGNAWALGQAYIERGGARIVATPLAWLRAGGQAVCILDWRAESPAWAKLSGSSWRADDPDLRRRIGELTGGAAHGYAA